MIIFNNNNNIFSVISLLFFYLNKDFYLHMSFNSDMTIYKFTYKQLQSVRAENIITHIQKFLNFSKQQLSKSRDSIKA